MAFSKCPSCSVIGQFEVANSPQSMKLSNPLGFIQCAACGAVVGVMESQNINAVLAKQHKATDQTLAWVVAALQRIAAKFSVQL